MAAIIHRAERGFVLITSIVMMAIVSLVVGAVLSYVSNATRQTSLAVGRDVCRLAAQSGIECAKTEVNAAFQKTISAQARIIGSMIGAESASAFDWFESYSGSSVKLTIGRSNPVNVGGERSLCGCTVQVGIGRVQHTVGDQFAVVTFVAEALRNNPGGTVSRAVIAETVRFAQERSKVFDNAYFVNNYGWFQGSGCTANGDVRANGDMYLDSSCKVNGRVYAAKNEELGVEGDVTNYGKMDNYSTYRTTTYGTGNMARPLKKDPNITDKTNSGGYDAPNTVTTQLLHNRIKANQPLSVEMPYIGDISSSASEYRDWAQNLHNKNPAMSTIKQNGQTLVSVFYDGVGPSGLATVTNSYGNEVTAPDYGAIVLTGTAAHPIEVNGPVIIPNDVIISGYVKGQGTIYSGRNIHIVGNIQYVNPPSWSGKSTSGTSNATKDMLGLMAKGNIVMGNYTESTWLSNIRTYLTQQPYVQQYACDTSDAAIGYPETFGGSYEAKEYVNNTDFGKCQSAGLTDYVPGGYDSSTGRFGKMREVGTGRYEQKQVYNSRTRRWETQNVEIMAPGIAYDRRYYESVCDDDEVSSRCSTITRIDAVLYNNHGIFGKLGQCSINGSLVCRNEGLQYSSKLYLNWDIRLYSESSETVDNEQVGLAKGSGNPPRTIGWIELPEDFVAFGDTSSGED